MIILEYLEGGTLAERIRRVRFTPYEGVELGLVMADVLDQIHRAAILHRDIKPSNIGYTADGVPKLLDFGLARMLDSIGATHAPDSKDASDADDTVSHVTHELAGTLAYLPPEAFRGRVSNVPRDLWALNVVLFECVAGHNPFRQKTGAETI